MRDEVRFIRDKHNTLYLKTVKLRADMFLWCMEDLLFHGPFHSILVVSSVKFVISDCCKSPVSHCPPL